MSDASGDARQEHPEAWDANQELPETEAVDAALDAIAFRGEIGEGIRRLRGAGGLTDIYEEQS